MGVEDDFKLAADEAKTLPKNTSNEDQLKLYGLFKQGTIGDVNTSAFTGLNDLHLVQLSSSKHDNRM